MQKRDGGEGRVKCQACERVFVLQARAANARITTSAVRCPKCGHLIFEYGGGRELWLEELPHA